MRRSGGTVRRLRGVAEVAERYRSHSGRSGGRMIEEAGQKMYEWQMEWLSFRSRTSVPAKPSVSPNIRRYHDPFRSRLPSRSRLQRPYESGALRVVGLLVVAHMHEGFDARPGLAVLPYYRTSGGSVVQSRPVRKHSQSGPGRLYLWLWLLLAENTYIQSTYIRRSWRCAKTWFSEPSQTYRVIPSLSPHANI